MRIPTPSFREIVAAGSFVVGKSRVIRDIIILNVIPSFKERDRVNWLVSVKGEKNHVRRSCAKKYRSVVNRIIISSTSAHPLESTIRIVPNSGNGPMVLRLFEYEIDLRRRY